MEELKDLALDRLLYPMPIEDLAAPPERKEV
jgi:hypothetical protein